MKSYRESVAQFETWFMGLDPDAQEAEIRRIEDHHRESIRIYQMLLDWSVRQAPEQVDLLHREIARAEGQLAAVRPRFAALQRQALDLATYTEADTAWLAGHGIGDTDKENNR